MDRFMSLGVIENKANFNDDLLHDFEKTISELKGKRGWSKEQLVKLFFKMIPGFAHKETGKYLDGKM